tara:strand:+ start:2512 stop:2661 length:150 start_codon:yes stop_codon:yes gene_type:complete
MSGAFPISNSKFETLGIQSIQSTIISKSISGKNYQELLILKDGHLLLQL